MAQRHPLGVGTVATESRCRALGVAIAASEPRDRTDVVSGFDCTVSSHAAATGVT